MATSDEIKNSLRGLLMGACTRAVGLTIEALEKHHGHNGHADDIASKLAGTVAGDLATYVGLDATQLVAVLDARYVLK